MGVGRVILLFARETYCLEGTVWLHGEGKRVMEAKGTIVTL